MKVMSALNVERALRALVVLCAVAACTEPNRNAMAGAELTPVLEARLDLSDSSARPESEVSVTLQLRGTQSTQVGSFTARVAYDSTGLKFAGETTLSDAATRVANPQPGLLRVAGIAPQGFKDGKLYVVRFVVVHPAALKSLHVFVDEIHSAAGTDVSAALAGSVP